MVDRIRENPDVFFTESTLPYRDTLDVRTPRLTDFGFPPDQSACATVFYSNSEPTSLPDIDVYSHPDGYYHKKDGNATHYPVAVYVRVPQNQGLNLAKANNGWWEGIGHAYRQQVLGDRTEPISTRDLLVDRVQRWGGKVLAAGGVGLATATGLLVSRTGSPVTDIAGMLGGAGVIALGDQIMANPVSVLTRVSRRDAAARRFAHTHRRGTGPIFPKSSSS